MALSFDGRAWLDLSRCFGPRNENLQMSSGIEKFLHQEHSEGRLDSEGAFTVALESALEKMARYTLERPSAWILKVIQGVVGLEASISRGRVLRGWTSLEVRFNENGPCWRKLSQAICRPDLQTDPALHDLAVGLWSLARGAEQSFSVRGVVKDPGKYTSEYPFLSWKGGELTVDDKGVGEELVCTEFTLSVERPPAGLLSRVARMFGGGSYFLDEMEELRNLAYLLPTEGWIEGMSGHHFLRAQTGVKGVARRFGISSYPNPFLWGWRYSEDLPELNLHPRWAEFAQHIKGGDYGPGSGQKWLALDLWGSHPVALWVLSFDFASWGLASARERSEIRWVRKGVIVDQTPLEIPEHLTIGLVLHLSAEGLPTDIGGMRLRPGEAFEARLEAGLALLRESIDPEDIRYKIFNWGLPHQLLEKCLQQVGELGQNLTPVTSHKIPPAP